MELLAIFYHLARQCRKGVLVIFFQLDPGHHGDEHAAPQPQPETASDNW
jgi:hypothetical protein